MISLRVGNGPGILMKPIRHVFLWLIELLSLAVIYSLLCYFVPDEALFSWYENKYGFVMENQWYNWFTTILMIVAVLFNCILIFCIGSLYRIKMKQNI